MYGFNILLALLSSRNIPPVCSYLIAQNVVLLEGKGLGLDKSVPAAAFRSGFNDFSIISPPQHMPLVPN